MDLPGRFGHTRITACGPEHAPPVLLLHGGGATAMAWTAVVGDLRRDHRVIAPDLVGDPGRSRNDGERLRSTADLCEWIDSVISGLRVGRVDVVAHSYGAMIAAAHAVHAPAAIGRLVLLDPNSCFAGMSRRHLTRALPLLVHPTEDRQRRLVSWETDHAPLDSDWLTVIAKGATFPASRTVVPRRPSRELLSRLADHPVTVVLAPGSKVHHPVRIADRVGALLPSASIVMLSSGTHHTLPMAPADELGRTLSDSLG
ncbi:alpha/beta fold hydrolase [Streptomyces sp. SID6673]|nr:alpha/beta fold hydrolase [Streptomyces sp. SID11726]NEB25269.1 alpha/beta fold hydrolase [Streptomyces sp. SID6673]